MNETIKQSQNPKELKKFGWLVGSIFGLISFYLFKKENPIWPYISFLSLFLLIFGTLAPKTLKYIFIFWMKLAVLMGTIMTTLILTCCYYLVFTPISFFIRKKDPLNQKWEPQAVHTTYWTPVNNKSNQPQTYEKQY